MAPVTIAITIFILILPQMVRSEVSPPSYGSKNASLGEPIPLAPRGALSAEDATKTELSPDFRWTSLYDDISYVLWIHDSKGNDHIIEIKKDAVECNKSTNVCRINSDKRKALINLPAGPMSWSLRAIKDNQTSIWATVQNYGNADSKIASCFMDSPLPGDLPSFRMFGGEWSAGTAVLGQLLKYDFSSKKAGLNTGLGAGASLRFYKDKQIKTTEPEVLKHGTYDTKAGSVQVPVSQIRSECRATSFRFISDNTVTAPLFSITPALFASKQVDSSDLAVQPALMVGFLQDLINIGVGFNLTGRQGEVGRVFLLMSVGVGFQF